MPRPTGSKNKKTLEREAIAAREAERRRIEAEAWLADKVVSSPTPLKKLGKEVLDDLMNLYMGLVAFHQPWPPSRGKNPTEDLKKFDYYSERAAAVAAALAPFQSPRLSAIAVGASIVNKVMVEGGMPNDFKPPVPSGQVLELKPGMVITADETKDDASDGAAVA